MKGTDRGWIESIRGCLEELEPLEPVPTGVAPRLSSIEGIRAVLFDIYGTLLISASGDVEPAGLSGAAALRALLSASAKIAPRNQAAAGAAAVEAYGDQILAVHEERRRRGIPYPEVDIVEVWRRVVGVLAQRGLVESEEGVDSRRLAFTFELASNPVYPMPGMAARLKMLQKSGTVLGIVSNAQFYTPIIMNYFLTGEAVELWRFPPFEHGLTLFSYEHGRAKPDPWLFEEAGRRLRRLFIKPEEALYVGNDMLKDVLAAKRAGFRTLLFAGDRRSLRLRKGEAGSVRPDGIITELAQIGPLLRR